MSDERLPLAITIRPWFQDHSFGDKIVLPAVETMLLLAANVVKAYPKVDVRVMENARFAKFLEIPPEMTTLEALFECADNADGRVQAKLLSRIHFSSMSRIKEHCQIFFSPANANSHSSPNIDPAPPVNSVTEVNVEQLYRELVPFGPNYHTLQETLYLSEKRAWGRLKAPDFLADPIQEIIGSPFPLDGALHAACVLGQQSVDFVPFPVGFDRRIITRPTQPGSCYITRVKLIARTDVELVFDLAIFDNDGQVYETITGVHMRDVSSALRN